jgi:hypothetical protein
MAELEMYFEHWEMFMEEELDQFRMDRNFDFKYSVYIKAKVENLDEEDPRAIAIVEKMEEARKQRKGKHLFEPNADTELGF